jgi:hypothetical protein
MATKTNLSLNDICQVANVAWPVMRQWDGREKWHGIEKGRALSQGETRFGDDLGALSDGLTFGLYLSIERNENT